MKILNGQELADFIKERQVKEVRSLKQGLNIEPHLAIIRTNPDPVVDSYMKLKQDYGQDIGVKVTVFNVGQPEAIGTISKLNRDKDVHGIIVQIPLPDPSETDEVLNSVAANKDVDGLAADSKFDPATPMAINWLLAGFNIDLGHEKQIVVVGQGRLVGRPLTEIWKKSNYNVLTADRSTKNLAELTKQADVLVCATGKPGLISADMIKQNAVVVDAGVATDNNGLVGDLDPKVREIKDITITPEKGGVGPLTVCALFENVLRGCRLG